MKSVRDRANCSAWLIFKNGELKGEVQAVFTSSTVTVDVWDNTRKEPMQQRKASGYGYDKLTAALAGCTVDGIPLNNHCGQNEETDKILKRYTLNVLKAVKESKNDYTLRARIEAINKRYKKRAAKLGALFANWSQFYVVDGKHVAKYNVEASDRDKYRSYWCWTSLYLASGLEKLRYFGYDVYQAI